MVGTGGSSILGVPFDPEGSWKILGRVIPLPDSLPSSSVCPLKSMVFPAPDQARKVLITRHMWIIPSRKVDVTAMRGPKMFAYVNGGAGVSCTKEICA